MQVIIITGNSGAGKNTALNILEDKGYSCIDNLPPQMLDLVINNNVKIANANLAFSINTITNESVEQLLLQLDLLWQRGVNLKVIFLEARTEVLIRRFSETRRKHPLLTTKNTITNCIEQEQSILQPLRNIASKIDTSDLYPNDLRQMIKGFINIKDSKLNIVLQSFGFKYGLPIDSDYLFDVRCLPNPHYDPNLRDYTGGEQEVVRFFDKSILVQQMLIDISEFLNKWLVNFERDNRNYLTISIGCTGGKHRSVYLVDKLYQLIKQQNYSVLVRHRQQLKNQS